MLRLSLRYKFLNKYFKMPNFTKAENCNQCPYKSKYLDFLPQDDVLTIQKNCLIVDFKKGETINKQGSQATHALYLAKGCVKVLLEGKNKNIIVNVVNKSGYITLHTIFSDKLHRCSIEAVEDSKICMIDADKFVNLTKRNPEFLFKITKEISRSVNCVWDKINDINQKHLKGRLSDVLINLAEKHYHSNKFKMVFTRKELAEMGAMSTENAVRTITELKKQGIIKESGKTFEITNMEILKKISEIG